jgi:hypothetical protein
LLEILQEKHDGKTETAFEGKHIRAQIIQLKESEAPGGRWRRAITLTPKKQRSANHQSEVEISTMHNYFVPSRKIA